MLTPYTRPQQTIAQILRRTAAREQSRRNPIVIGPEYKLMLNDGRELSKHAFTGVGATLSYETGSGTDLNLTVYEPVASGASLYGDDLEAKVATIGSGIVTMTDTSLRDLYLSVDDFAGAGTLHVSLDGRAAKVGDTVEIKSTTDGNASTVRRKVVQLLGAITPAPAAGTLSKTAAPDNAITNGADGGYLVPTGTTSGYSFALSDVADLLAFKVGGKVLADGANNKYLADEISVEFTTGGASNAAVVTITSLATGLTAAGVSTNQGTTATDFEIELDDVGHAGTTIELTAPADTATAGDTAVVRVFPAYTIPNTAVDITVGGAYTADVDRRYVVEFVDADATNGKVRVYDTSGKEVPASVNDPSVAFDLGSGGLTATFADTDYYVGQKFFIDAVAKVVSTTEFSGVKVDGPSVNADDWATAGSTTITEFNIFQSYTGPIGMENLEVGDTDPLTMGAADFSYAAALGLPNSVTGRSGLDHSPFETGYGEIYLSYKALRKPTELEGMIELESTEEIADQVGENDQENWLGRGAKVAFDGNQGRVTYALRTAGDSVEDFTAALNKIRTTDQIYALVGLTERQDVKILLKDHVELMSDKYNKNFRRAYVGTDSPGSYLHWGELDGGGYRQATLIAQVVTIEEEYRSISKFSEDDVGSTISLIGLGGSYAITEVLSDYECVLDIDTGLTVNPAAGITLTRPDTAAATALYVIEESNALNSRRVSNVWTDNPTVGTGTGTEASKNMFLAAEVAGLRCALLPQQGLTHTEILSVDSIPGMYTRFTPELIDSVAANGTMVITQESVGGDVFIRHQLTTKAENDGALEYEDNIGVIVDEFAYAEKDAFRGYIGVRNATPATIEAIDNELRELASDFTQVDIADRDIGPMVLEFFDENGEAGQVTVRQDGDLSDTLMTYVKLRIPLPLNGINNYIDVEATEVLASADNA